MRQIDIDTFSNLEDACIWLEEKLDHYYFEEECEDIKGEIVLIDGKFRTSIITNTSQGELDFG